MTEPSAGTVLITGASGGIGLEFARLFAADRHDLVLVARGEERLREVADELAGRHGIAALPVALDLSQPGAPDELTRHTEAEGITVDVLVNNAGYGTWGQFVDADLTTELNQLQLNVVALTHLCKLYVPAMKERGFGRVLNVASTAAFQPGPTMAVYYASKAYVLHLSEALTEELRGTGVTVTCLCPGPTRSDFQERAGMHESRLVKGRRLPDAARVAAKGYRAMQKGRAVYIEGMRNYLLAQALRFSPRAVNRRVSGRLTKS